MTFVIDASVAVKWVVTETGSAEAIALLKLARPIAPELLFAECANIFWKKVQRKELSAQVALLAAQALEKADLELVSLRGLLRAATRIAVELDHPAYDCTYLALALERQCRFVTADARLTEKVRRSGRERLAESIATLADMTGQP